MICHEWYRYGHTKSRCTKEEVCRKCGNTDHSINDCENDFAGMHPFSRGPYIFPIHATVILGGAMCAGRCGDVGLVLWPNHSWRRTGQYSNNNCGGEYIARSRECHMEQREENKGDPSKIKNRTKKSHPNTNWGR